MLQTLPFDPALGPAIPLPKNFTIEKQTNDEITIIGQKPDTKTQRNYHVRITFHVTDGWVNKICLKQEKYEQYRTWMVPPDWRKNGSGSKCRSDWVIKALLMGTWS